MTRKTVTCPLCVHVFAEKENFRANVFQIFEARISCTLLEFDDNNNRFSMTLQQQ
jgi:hypothetical protein